MGVKWDGEAKGPHWEGETLPAVGEAEGCGL